MRKKKGHKSQRNKRIEAGGRLEALVVRVTGSARYPARPD
jgi:hypothetical protein